MELRFKTIDEAVDSLHEYLTVQNINVDKYVLTTWFTLEKADAPAKSKFEIGMFDFDIASGSLRITQQ